MGILNPANMPVAASDLSKMKLADLKKELQARGLPVGGKKNELQERLQEALAAEGREVQQGATLTGKRRTSSVPLDVITPDKKTAKLGQNANPVVSDKPDSEKSAQEKRAERFGLPVNDAALKDARAARFGLPVNDAALKDARAARFGIISSAPSSTGTTVDKKAALEKLKERSARFGEVSSKTLQKIETLEKKKERAERFKNGTDNSKDAEIKKKRAERFAAK